MPYAVQSPSVTDWFGAITGTVTASVAVLAIGIALWQVFEARAARKQTRRLELERSQPYVAMWAEIGVTGHMLVDIVIKNFGPTAARDVRIEIDPKPMRDNGMGSGWEPVPLPEVIPYLAPGQEWRTFWDAGAREDLSFYTRPHKGRLTYSGTEEDDRRESPVLLDWSMWTTTLFTEQRTMDDLAKAVEKIEGYMSRYSEGVGRGLSVFVRSGDRADRRLEERLADQRGRRSQQGRAPSSKGE